MKKVCIAGFIVLVCLIGFEQHFFTATQIHAQTVPTRTPVPPSPTQPPSGGGNNGGSNPTSTNTPAPPTATPIPATIGPSPEGGYLPTAEPCSNTPTIQARNNTNVRFGPGTDYDIVGQLIYLEIRPIIGRAQDAQWWYIALADGTTGFVFDDVVMVSGYTDIVPIVPVPELDGNTPTPGPEWNPTPNPNCTVTPTALPTNTPVPTATATAVLEPTATPETLPTDTAVLPTETPTLVTQPTRVTTATPLPTAVPLAEPAANSGSSSWLLFGAGGLLVVGVILLIVRRR